MKYKLILFGVIELSFLGGCPEGYFSCGKSNICIIQKHICDGHKDCPNADDEEPMYCGKYFFFFFDQEKIIIWKLVFIKYNLTISTHFILNYKSISNIYFLISMHFLY